PAIHRRSTGMLGALIPYVFFIDFFSANPLSGFIPALFVNGAAGGFTADLLISSFVFWVFMWGRKDHGPSPIPFVLINLTIGLSCALPAYLYFNEKAR
ncbi:MAG: DUF2834 domain-containing protein, partial [Pseudomonadota bacterium]